MHEKCTILSIPTRMHIPGCCDRWWRRVRRPDPFRAVIAEEQMEEPSRIQHRHSRLRRRSTEQANPRDEEHSPPYSPRSSQSNDEQSLSRRTPYPAPPHLYAAPNSTEESMYDQHNIMYAHRSTTHHGTTSLTALTIDLTPAPASIDIHPLSVTS